DRFTATIDDDALVRGVYELRARVRDRAGNEAVGDRRRDGSTAHVDLASVRIDTRLTAGLVSSKSRATTRCRRKHGRRTCVRTLRFRFAGSARERSSQQEVTVSVPAAATIAASRNRVRNGQTVTFRGRLAGRPIPADGKLLDLQAFYRGRWRTFATPRAGSNGAWRYVYRFGATRGRVLY